MQRDDAPADLGGKLDAVDLTLHTVEHACGFIQDLANAAALASGKSCAQLDEIKSENLCAMFSILGEAVKVARAQVASVRSDNAIRKAMAS